MQYEVKIDPQLWKVYPEIRLGVMQFDTTVKKSDAQFWNYVDKEVLPQVQQAIEGKEWGEIPGIRGSRAAYKAFGRNPGRYRVSSEALIRRVRRGDGLYHINSVVDVNNLLSIKSGLSVGSYDLDKLHGTITLRKAEASEGYTGIGKDFIDMENMLVLADDKGIFGSSMSDSMRAMVTEITHHVLVVVYCFEDGIDLHALLENGKKTFADFSDIQNAKVWIVEELK